MAIQQHSIPLFRAPSPVLAAIIALQRSAFEISVWHAGGEAW